MIIDSNKNLVDLQNDLNNTLGQFFNKTTIKKLSKVVVGKGNINLEIVKGKLIEKSDGVFIKEITTYYTNRVKEETDLTYEVITENLIPGIIKQTLVVSNGVLRNKTGLFNSALLSNFNSIVFKEKQIKIRDSIEKRMTIYALIKTPSKSLIA